MEKNNTASWVFRYFNMRLREKDKRDQQRWEAGQEAIKHVNEVRTEIQKIRSDTMSREETNSRIDALSDRIGDLKHWQDERGGMFTQADKHLESSHWNVEITVAIIAALAGAAVAFFVKK
jgi:hypothetical protein